jgi:hypothetical protein
MRLGFLLFVSAICATAAEIERKEDYFIAHGRILAEAF